MRAVNTAIAITGVAAGLIAFAIAAAPAIAARIRRNRNR